MVLDWLSGRAVLVAGLSAFVACRRGGCLWAEHEHSRQYCSSCLREQCINAVPPLLTLSSTPPTVSRPTPRRALARAAIVGRRACLTSWIAIALPRRLSPSYSSRSEAHEQVRSSPGPFHESRPQ